MEIRDGDPVSGEVGAGPEVHAGDHLSEELALELGRTSPAVGV